MIEPALDILEAIAYVLKKLLQRLKGNTRAVFAWSIFNHGASKVFNLKSVLVEWFDEWGPCARRRFNPSTITAQACTYANYYVSLGDILKRGRFVFDK